MKLTAERLVAATGCAVRGADVLADALERAMDPIINTPLRVAHFVAQTAFESGLYVYVEENLNYSAERLAVVFPRYFGPGRADPAAYARQKERIANLVYANRMGNGPPASGDGYRFRGRGWLQLTGRDNYTALDRDVPALGCLVNPDALILIPNAARSAAWFWNRTGCNVPADAGSVEGVTRKINGGTNGLAERIVLTRRALAALA